MSDIKPHSCSFSSNKTLSRNVFTLPKIHEDLTTTFHFLSKILSGCLWVRYNSWEELLTLMCPVSTLYLPSLSLESSPPPTGVTVTPDLTQPDWVTLTCSVDTPHTAPTTTNGNGGRMGWHWAATQTSYNQSTSSLLISGVRYSDAGVYRLHM